MSTDKTERLQIRLTSTEKEMLFQKASESRMTVSDYIMALLEKKRIIDTKKLAALIIEIRRIGVNINQIAAVANTQKYISKELMAKVDQHEVEIINLLQEILDEVYDAEEHTLESLEEKIDRLSEKIERLDKNGSS